MVKSNNTISQHLSGSKGNTLNSQLHYKDLENVMVVPIEVGKSYNKALVANYFGCLLKDPFEFHNSREGFRLLHNTIADVAKNQPVEEVLIGMEATGHYFKNPAESLAEMGYNNLFILNPLSTSHCRKAGLTWSKTDDIDLRAVGQALISGYGTVFRLVGRPEADLSL
jgi:transposase